MKKNSYESTDVTYQGGLEYGSDIHSVAVRTNHIVWDMIKILDKNQLFGFHFQTKISTHKIIIIMRHEREEMLERAKSLLADFSDIPNVLFLAKQKKQKQSKRVLKISIALILLFMFLFGLYRVGFYLYQNGFFYFENQKETKVVDENSTKVIVVKLDIQKLKAIKESFDKENSPIEPKIMKAMDITTAVISDMVPPSQKRKYSSEELVKNFKSKGGIKFVIDDSNKTKEFNQTVEELNSYAMDFIKNQNLSSAIKCYDKILQSKDKNIKEEDIANALSQKAKLNSLRGDLNISRDDYIKSLEITTQMAKDNPQKYGATRAFSLSHLSKVENSLGLNKDAKKHINEATKEYENGLERFKQLYKSNPKKYIQDLAWNYNIVANFYLDEIYDINKSINYRLKAINLYQKLYRQKPDIAILPLFKSFNSLGRTYMKLGDIKDAKINYQKGFKVISKSKYQNYIALSHHNLGFVYSKNREFTEALSEYNRAKELYKSFDKNSTDNILSVDYDISSLYSYQHRYKEALKGYRDVVRGYNLLKKSDKVAKAQNQMAWIYITQPKLKNYKKARDILNSSIRLLENRQKDTIEYKEVLAQSYSYLAHLELLENRIDKSLSYYQKSLSINRDFQTDIRYSTLLIAQNSFLKAFRNFELMLKRYKGLEQQAKILMEYGNFYTTINQNIAKEKLLDSLKLYKKLSMINNKIYKEIDIISKELEVNIQTQKRT